MWPSITYGYKKLKWASVASRTPLKALFQRPLPSAKTHLSQCNYLVVDCEMSGLNPNKNELLSIGWVGIREGKIEYNSRTHVLVHSDATVGDSIKIHGLCDRQLAGAASPSKALTLLAQQASHSILVFHHAVLDRAFLNKSSLATFNCPLVFPYVDTMQIERQRLARQQKTGSLQLNLCRDRYSLPPAFEHNAMSDAVATAELFLAQCAYLQANGMGKLRDIGMLVH